ncbi:unnamed protein product, partial [Mesorhabditis spiculigera]
MNVGLATTPTYDVRQAMAALDAFIFPSIPFNEEMEVRRTSTFLQHNLYRMFEDIDRSKKKVLGLQNLNRITPQGCFLNSKEANWNQEYLDQADEADRVALRYEKLLHIALMQMAHYPDLALKIVPSSAIIEWPVKLSPTIEVDREPLFHKKADFPDKKRSTEQETEKGVEMRIRFLALGQFQIDLAKVNQCNFGQVEFHVKLKQADRLPQGAAGTVFTEAAYARMKNAQTPGLGGPLITETTDQCELIPTDNATYFTLKAKSSAATRFKTNFDNLSVHIPSSKQPGSRTVKYFIITVEFGIQTAWGVVSNRGATTFFQSLNCGQQREFRYEGPVESHPFHIHTNTSKQFDDHYLTAAWSIMIKNFGDRLPNPANSKQPSEQYGMNYELKMVSFTGWQGTPRLDIRIKLARELGRPPKKEEAKKLEAKFPLRLTLTDRDRQTPGHWIKAMRREMVRLKAIELPNEKLFTFEMLKGKRYIIREFGHLVSNASNELAGYEISKTDFSMLQWLTHAGKAIDNSSRKLGKSDVTEGKDITDLWNDKFITLCSTKKNEDMAKAWNKANPKLGGMSICFDDKSIDHLHISYAAGPAGCNWGRVPIDLIGKLKKLEIRNGNVHEIQGFKAFFLQGYPSQFQRIIQQIIDEQPVGSKLIYNSGNEGGLMGARPACCMEENEIDPLFGPIVRLSVADQRKRNLAQVGFGSLSMEREQPRPAAEVEANLAMSQKPPPYGTGLAPSQLVVVDKFSSPPPGATPPQHQQSLPPNPYHYWPQQVQPWNTYPQDPSAPSFSQHCQQQYPEPTGYFIATPYNGGYPAWTAYDHSFGGPAASPEYYGMQNGSTGNSPLDSPEYLDDPRRHYQ